MHHLSFKPCKVAGKLDSWIHLALRKKVKVLELDMLDTALYGPVFNYALPDFVLTADSLVELKLVSCVLKGQTHMGSLTTLSLTAICLGDAMMEEMLSGCPLLEHLSIIRCYGLNKLNLTSTSLKNLMVTLGEGESSELDISCPNLRSLKITMAIWRACLRNSTCVTDATLDFFCGGRYSNQEYRHVGLLLKELSGAKILKVCHWCILVLAMLELNDRAFSSTNHKNVVLKTKLTKWHIFGIASLLKSSPNLEILTIHIEPSTSILTSDDLMWLRALGIDQDNFWNNETLSLEFDGGIFWSTQQHTPCLKSHLKSVTIHGCIEHPYLFQLVKFLIGSSAVLEKMVISFNRQYCCENLLEFSRNLASSPRASNCAVVMFPEIHSTA